MLNPSRSPPGTPSSAAWAAVAVLLATAACGPAVTDEQAAERAVLGLRPALTRTIQLGFDGFNAADSANIPAQSASGDEDGTLAITGQVDQGNSPNKEMRLEMALTDYNDGPVEETVIIYSTADGAPVSVDLSLRNIPEGTLTGSIEGAVTLSGDLSGPLDLVLTVAGEITAGDADAVELVDGQTDVSGTATSDYGQFDLDFAF